MEGTAKGRSLEAFIKREIASSRQIRSIVELSRVSGIRPSTMYEWFSGLRVPRTDSLSRIAAALGVSASRLLDAYEGQPAVEVNDAAVAAIERAVERGIDAAFKRLAANGRIVIERHTE